MKWKHLWMFQKETAQFLTPTTFPGLFLRKRKARIQRLKKGWFEGKQWRRKPGIGVGGRTSFFSSFPSFKVLSPLSELEGVRTGGGRDEGKALKARGKGRLFTLKVVPKQGWTTPRAVWRCRG